MIKVSDWSNSFFSKTTLNKYSYKELKISDKMNIIFYNRCPLHDHNIMEMVWDYMERTRWNSRYRQENCGTFSYN